MTRIAFTSLGLLTLAIAWIAPVSWPAPGSFSAHMTMQMAVVAVAAPLLALGIARSRLDPVARAPRLLSPIPMSIVELVVVWAWHAPALHHLARRSALGLVAEQGTFLASALLVWLAALGGNPAADRRGDRVGAGIVALLLTFMHMTLLGALLALSPRPLYEHEFLHGPLSPMDDQHLGGAIMLFAGGLSYLAGGLWLTSTLLREAPKRRHVGET